MNATPTITLSDAYAYAGHIFEINIFEGDSVEDITWEVESTFAGSFQGGVYPSTFAGLESAEAIENHLISGKASVDTVGDMVNVLLDTVQHLISRNVLDGVK